MQASFMYQCEEESALALPEVLQLHTMRNYRLKKHRAFRVRDQAHLPCKPTPFFFLLLMITIFNSLQTNFDNVMIDKPDKNQLWGTRKCHLQGQLSIIKTRIFFNLQ